MTLMTIGDLAQTYLLRHSSGRLTRSISTLGEELTTGLKKDVARAMNGDTAAVASIDRALLRLESDTLAAKEFGIKASVTGTALEAFSNRFHTIDLGTLSSAQTGPHINAIAANAKNAFFGALSDLGTKTGETPLFAGAAGVGPVLRPADEIFSDMLASVSGASTPDDVINGIDAYFADGGPFATIDYLGSTQDTASVTLGDGAKVSLQVRADNSEIRAGLAAMARLAILGEPLALSAQDKSEVASSAASSLVHAQTGITGTRALVGTAEAAAEAAQVRLGTERDSLRVGRLSLLAADPYETAVKLQQTELQIETLHTLTARLSRLNLTNYMR